MPIAKNPFPRLLRHLAGFLILTPATVFGHGFNVLVFTKTSGENHASIPAGITALTELGVEHDFGVTQTADASTFVSQLASHHVVVFLNTTGDVLDASQQSAFQSWYQSGEAA